MNMIKATSFFCLSLVLTLTLMTEVAEAQRRGRGGLSGDVQFNIGFGLMTASQSDLNNAIDRANAAQSTNAKNIGSGYEIFGSYIYRFERSMYSFIFRPSYILQSEGDYKLSGYTVFPMFRITPLENSFIKFFMQGGVGYGSLSGDWKNNTDNFQFKGSAFGGMAGIGVDFCLFESSCITIEGNTRYLPIERNIVTGGTCTPGNGFGQCSNSEELEYNSKDVGTSLSGILGTIAWTFNF